MMDVLSWRQLHQLKELLSSVAASMLVLASELVLPSCSAAANTARLCCCKSVVVGAMMNNEHGNKQAPVLVFGGQFDWAELADSYFHLWFVFFLPLIFFFFFFCSIWGMAALEKCKV